MKIRVDIMCLFYYGFFLRMLWSLFFNDGGMELICNDKYIWYYYFLEIIKVRNK